MPTNIILATPGHGIARAERRADDDWQVTRLVEDQKVYCLAAAPDGQTSYAGSQQGMLRSTDRGCTWQALTGAPADVKALDVSRHDPNTIYAGVRPAGVYVSRDGGETWQESEGFKRIPNRWWWLSPAEPPDRRPYVFAITESPTEPGVVLAGVEFGAVVRSEDGGLTWSRHRRGALRDCHSLKFHHSNGAWAYQAGGSGGGAAVSRDGGRTFEQLGRGLAKRYGIVCGADPAQPEVWYVCTGPSPFAAFGKNSTAYLYRSDGGAGWQPIGWSDHPLKQTPTALVTQPGAPGHVWAGLHGGEVMHSSNYGDTWEKLPLNLGGIWFGMLVL
jgi:photosystem II stability/assembly factor-like uncharacterized protein